MEGKKKTVLFGAGQFGSMLARLAGAGYEPVAFADNSPKKQGSIICGLPVLSPAEALALIPEVVFLCVPDGERAGAMRLQLKELGYAGEVITAEALQIFDPRAATMRLLAEQINAMAIPGDIAELGVFRGEFAALISRAFPGRTFHLFDTFEGFAAADVAAERKQGYSRAAEKDFSATSEELVLSRLSEPERAVLRKGWFPDTFAGCEGCRFAFVSIDADLYLPTAAALPRFWERLVPGGVLMLHDVYSTQFAGVREAVDEFCREKGILPMPVCDLHGSAVLRKEK